MGNKYICETVVRVQYYETDAMGIVHHSNYVRYFETARTELMRSQGYPYDQMEKDGIMMPVLGVNVEFKTPALYDEELILACWITNLKGASVELEYEIRGKENGQVHARGTSRHGFTDLNLKPIKLKKVVPHIYEMFKELEV